ncbi:glycosyltransferase family 2 protein [Mycobacterium sp. PSTR-4-N]|uniref:glycosyltransferase family 2 protein n=1 Tax=Mycobacterium sp. PSTR-4-N TaxID=2917745 RepID=UPI001F14E6C6|nr:glycosyltransferase family 2 protein [Mycobacterium sp. PSTR-4-N]MCG7597654.1 glycosyltransferase [Mycobacterium sp. PSTR-4-N]
MVSRSPGARTSFVIASRNRSDELASVLRRLLDTTNSPIILVDNGSEDDSVQKARRLADEADGRLTVVELAENLGAVGRNVGVTRAVEASTPYVAFCDDDSWWDAASIGLAEELFDAYPTLAVLAARTLVMPSGREDPIVAELASSPLGHDPALPGPSILGFLACSAIVRASAFEAVGGFSPIIHFRGEETLLAWDLAAHGWDLCFCDRLTAFHQPSTHRGTSAAQDARSMRNAVLTTWLRRPLRHCLRATAGFVRAAATDRAHAGALGEAVRKVPAVLAARRRLPDETERALRVLES